MKTTMVGCISHELRTPLNCIINFLNEGLEYSKNDEKICGDYLNPCLDSAEYLLNIINSILAYTKI
jgi:signal transduction histidine kinase|tara:strand:- start:642 stop:839 length:198 start_codon:yes stop_codon:yes gene_type:complete